MNPRLPKLHPNITAYIPMVGGIIALLQPYAEGAIHDLRTGKIAALYNNISKRKVGDPSAVTELGIEVKDFPDFFEPYYKTNWDGRKLKCTSVTIRDENGVPIGLVCINFDTSVFENMQTQLHSFLKLKGEGGLNPIDEFAGNWQQQATAFIEEYLAKRHVALTGLAKAQKTELANQMYDHGFFNYRDAATFIAKTLSVSRATIYNYIREAKGKA
ncbi:MAG TPA: PAS domain-containing protein [Candidatus Saccharimonadales bacterium]|nr:PAS domain-containing protein [Candidatus Saccharimonadales bacterium]